RRAAHLEFAAIPALVEMEHNGMGFHQADGSRLLERLRGEKNALADELQSRAKSMGIKDFNPLNPAHAKKALNELGYDVKNTSAAVLERVIRENEDERFAVLISKYREIHLK